MAITDLSSVRASRKGLAGNAGRTVVWLRGEHDISTVDDDLTRLAQAIEFDDGEVVVDLSAVTFMDASTVSVISRADRYLRDRSRSLALRSPSTCARRILDLLGLTDLVESPCVDRSRTAHPAGTVRTLVTVSTRPHLRSVS